MRGILYHGKFMFVGKNPASLEGGCRTRQRNGSDEVLAPLLVRVYLVEDSLGGLEVNQAAFRVHVAKDWLGSLVFERVRRCGEGYCGYDAYAVFVNAERGIGQVEGCGST
jgi:hypothetical protein